MSRLRELRKERGYTQIKMQMLTGIDQSAYSKIERKKMCLLIFFAKMRLSCLAYAPFCATGKVNSRRLSNFASQNNKKQTIKKL